MRYSWITLDTILAIHDYQIAAHGGKTGIRDLGLIESALARAQNRSLYEDASTPELAADYGFGLVKNHGFIDGNKRTAYVATRLFLKLHGMDFSCDPVSRVLVFESLGAGEISEEEFLTWVKNNTIDLEPPSPSL